MTGSVHVCKHCGNNYEGNYCNNCGEKRYTEADKSIGHLLGEGFHFITHFEGTFFNSLKAVLFRPGQLSLDYCNGIRKKYFKPISFFLLLVILYLLFPMFTGLNMSLYFHEKHGLYGDYALRKVSEVVQAKHITEAQLSDLFHQKSDKVSKFLLFIIIPAMGLFSWLFAFRKRKLFFDNLIFSIEAGAFLILWGYLIFPLILLVLRIIFGGDLLRDEAPTLITMVLVYAIQVTRAAKRFFGFAWWYSALYGILYTIALALFIEEIYKFFLFFITIHLV